MDRVEKTAASRTDAATEPRAGAHVQPATCEGERFVTRQQAAARLGCSVSEVRRRENAGTLTPAGRSRLGAVVFHVSDIEEQPRKGEGRGAAPVCRYTAEEAGRVFDALDEGLSLVDIVRTRKLHPEVVKAAALAHAELAESLYIPAATMRAMTALPLPGVWPPTNADELLVCMRDVAEDAACRTCGQRARTHCARCGSDAVRKRARAAADA